MNWFNFSNNDIKNNNINHNSYNSINMIKNNENYMIN
jgi:hypothetical protein